jgi:RNA polymerase sigma-70 factor (ECF subfamily)
MQWNCIPAAQARAKAVLCVDRTDGNWFDDGVQMNLSTHKPDGASRAGDGKKLNPDAPTAGDGGARSASSKLAAAATKTVMREEPADEQLLAEYRAGDKTKFAVLVLRYQRELYHFLVRFLGDRAAAEDVFQETFLQVHQSADQFDPSRRFRPWLFTIAANKARDLIRSQARRPTNPLQASISAGDEDSGEFIDLMSAASSMPGEPLEREELQQQVQKTVMGMPEHLREILLLSYFHQFPYKQIGDILDIPLGTVKSRLHAAVAHFADRWRSSNHGKMAS